MIGVHGIHAYPRTSHSNGLPGIAKLPFGIGALIGDQDPMRVSTQGIESVPHTCSF